MKGKIYKSTSRIRTHELYNTLVAGALSHCVPTLLENIFWNEKLLNYTFNFIFFIRQEVRYNMEVSHSTLIIKNFSVYSAVMYSIDSYQIREQKTNIILLVQNF